MRKLSPKQLTWEEAAGGLPREKYEWAILGSNQ